MQPITLTFPSKVGSNRHATIRYDEPNSREINPNAIKIKLSGYPLYITYLAADPLTKLPFIEGEPAVMYYPYRTMEWALNPTHAHEREDEIHIHLKPGTNRDEAVKKIQDVLSDLDCLKHPEKYTAADLIEATHPIPLDNGNGVEIPQDTRRQSPRRLTIENVPDRSAFKVVMEGYHVPVVREIWSLLSRRLDGDTVSKPVEEGGKYAVTVTVPTWLRKSYETGKAYEALVKDNGLCGACGRGPCRNACADLVDVGTSKELEADRGNVVRIFAELNRPRSNVPEDRIEIPVDTSKNRSVAIVHNPKSQHFRITLTGYPPHIADTVETEIAKIAERTNRLIFVAQKLEDKPQLIKAVQDALTGLDCLKNPEHHEAPKPQKPPTQDDVRISQPPIENGVEIPVRFDRRVPWRRISIENVPGTGIKIVMQGYPDSLARGISAWVEKSLSRFVTPGNVTESRVPVEDRDRETIPVQTIELAVKLGQSKATVSGQLYALLLSDKLNTMSRKLCGGCAQGPCMRRCEGGNIDLFDGKAYGNVKAAVGDVTKKFSGLENGR